MKIIHFVALVVLMTLITDDLKAQLFTESIFIREYKRSFFFKCIPNMEGPKSLFFEAYSGLVPYDSNFKEIHSKEISALVKLVHEEMILSNKEVISESHGFQMVLSNKNVITRCLNYYDGPLLDSLAKRAALDPDYYKK